MTDKIEITDVKLKYATIQEAKQMSGLRIVLGAVAVPGPWREACKGIFYVKKIPYTPVASAGEDGTQRELIEWTAQASTPVAIWNHERPRSTWIEQLYLAERLHSTPALIPSILEQRISMFGIINEICGENGFAWSRRLMMINALVTNPNVDEKTREFWTRFGSKYNYSTAGAAAAPARLAEIVTFVSGLLEQQKAKGSKFYIGDRLTALDIYSATFAGALEPLPPELCPMDSTFRDLYTEKNAVVRAAMSPRLMEHRDFIYHQYLELPVVF